MSEQLEQQQEEIVSESTTQSDEQTDKPSILDKIIKKGRFSKETKNYTTTVNTIGNFVEEILKESIQISSDTEEMIINRIAQIDKLISLQLNEVMHHEDFQKLEASWKGLHYLVKNSETGTSLKIKVLNVSKDDLRKDMEKATDFKQSAVFKKVYTAEYDQFGGAPFGVLIGDYEFGNNTQDMSLINEVSHVASAAHAPFISAAAPELFNWDSFTDLTNQKELANIFEGAEYAEWRSFRDTEDSRYVALTLPHVLMRNPYGKAKGCIPVEGFDFEEDVDGKDHSKYLWGNAAYAFAARLTDAFAKYSWCVRIRGVENGGLVTDLPVHTFPSEGGIELKCPTEVIISDTREKEFADLGFIPLVHCKGENFAAFFSVQTTNKPRKYDEEYATKNAELSAKLQYLICVCRFAHYLKSIMRDKIGGFMNREAAEAFLKKWINQYVITPGPGEIGDELRAKHPLSEAKVVVTGDAGKYKAVAYLKPHYQLDEIKISLRLVADLPPPSK